MKGKLLSYDIGESAKLKLAGGGVGNDSVSLSFYKSYP